MRTTVIKSMLSKIVSAAMLPKFCTWAPGVVVRPRQGFPPH